MKHLGTQTRETERLVLRPFGWRTPEPCGKTGARPAVTKYLTWPPHADVSVSRAVLEDWTGAYQKPDFYSGPSFRRTEKTGPSVPSASWRKTTPVRMVHIGYCIGRKWWRQGITSEALGALIGFLLQRGRHQPHRIAPRPAQPELRPCHEKVRHEIRGHPPSGGHQQPGRFLRQRFLCDSGGRIRRIA